MQLLTLLATFVFTLAGLFSLFLIRTDISLQTLLQIIAIVILAVILTTRFVFKKIAVGNKTLAYLIESLVISLFIYVLVFSTGSLTSPFLIMTHLYAIGVAFLISQQITVSFVFITVAFLILSIRFDSTVQLQLAENQFTLILYFLAYIAILPFTNFLAKVYRQKEAWVEELSQMLSTSKKHQETLLKNIEDAVVVLSKDLKVSFINNAVKIKTGYSEGDLIGKNFFDVFTIKDNSGSTLESEKLPFSAVLATKNEVKVDKLQISTKSGKFLRVNLKILPVIDHTGQILGLMVIVKDVDEKAATSTIHLDKAEEKISMLPIDKLKTIATDLLLMSRLESNVVEGLSSFINISGVVEKEMIIMDQIAKAKNVKLTCPSPASETVLPKGKIVMPEKHCIFPVVYVLSNEKLLKVAIHNLLKVAVALAETSGKVRVDVQTAPDVVKFELSINNKIISQNEINLLFSKFFNELVNLPNMELCSGLEIAIACEIFEKHGGMLKITKNQKGVLISATLIRPEMKIHQSNNPSPPFRLNLP